MFRIGQKVVCVDDEEWSNHQRRIRAGEIYTIAAFGVHPADGNEECAFLVGVKRIFRGVDYPFGLYRFRPIVERKTDISVFTKMLTPQGIEA